MQLTDPELLETTTREEVAERIESIVELDSEVDVIEAQVRFQQHDEDRRGRSLVRCSVRVWTDDRQLAGTGEEYRGRLLENLNEL